MTTVPYQPVSTVEPSQQGAPNIRLDTPGAAFGENVGKAMSHLGQTLEGAGDEMFKRAMALQAVANEAEAKAADAKYIIEAGKLHADYNALSGKAAVDAFPQYQHDLNNARLNIRSSLSNDASKRAYDGPSLTVFSRSVFNGAGHAATENKRYVAGASTAKMDATREDTLQNPKDERAFRQGLANGEAEIVETQAPIAGWGPEQTDAEIAKWRSSMIAARITGLSRTEPITAKRLFDGWRSDMRAADVERVERIVNGQLYTTGARNISDEVNGDLYEDPSGEKKSLEKRVAEAKEKAEKIDPDNTVFHDYVRERVIADFNRSRAIKRDFDLSNKNTVDTALVGGYGALPTNVDELVATDPKVREAWEQLPPSAQRGYLKALSQNTKVDDRWTENRLRRYQYLFGLSGQDPEKFLGFDIPSEDLPYSKKVELVKLQDAVRKKPESDPRVTKGMQILSPDLRAAGLKPTDDEYIQFRGALHDAIQDFQAQTKKLPTADEYQVIGRRLLQQQAVGWWSGERDPSGFSKKPMFQIKVPEADAKIIESDPAWEKIGVKPTPEQVQRVYTRQLYQKLYSGAKPEETPGKPKPPQSQ